MSLSREQFERQWLEAGQDQTASIVETAWKRFQQVHSPDYHTIPEDASSSQWSAGAWRSFFVEQSIAKCISQAKFLTLPASSLPFTRTNINAAPGQQISTFATGRVWRSRPLDLYLQPQFALWYKVGNNGRVFCSTGDSNSFEPSQKGKLYVANQFPGQFGEPDGGRVAGRLSVYEKVEGEFGVSIVVWKNGVDVASVLAHAAKAEATHGAVRKAIERELSRIRQVRDRKIPLDWHPLWFLGKSTIYSAREDKDGNASVHCKPYNNVGIIQKDLSPHIQFNTGIFAAWDWLVTSLPSRLREDTNFTHDYLSVAFEFENGRDITYTWSWELPVEYGYWCPLENWQDREYHVVIRNGTKDLGKWLSEKRNLHADYVKYIGGLVPDEITRVWLIAGNRWQRLPGEMTMKNLLIHDDSNSIKIL